jgi:hypothetical protein
VNVEGQDGFYIRTETDENGQQDTKVKDFSQIYLLKQGEHWSIRALHNGLQANSKYALHETNTNHAKRVLSWIKDGEPTSEVSPNDIVRQRKQRHKNHGSGNSGTKRAAERASKRHRGADKMAEEAGLDDKMTEADAEPCLRELHAAVLAAGADGPPASGAQPGGDEGGGEDPKKQKCTAGQIESHQVQSSGDRSGGGSHKIQSPKSDSQPAASHMPDVKRAAESGSCAGGEATKQQKLTGEGELSVGTMVEIHSLLRAPELNGVRGEIVGPPPQDPGIGQWSVKIEKEGRLVAFKSSNLRLVSTPSLRGAAKKIQSHQDQCYEGPGSGSRDIPPLVVSLGQGGDSMGQDPCDAQKPDSSPSTSDRANVNSDSEKEVQSGANSSSGRGGGKDYDDDGDDAGNHDGDDGSEGSDDGSDGSDYHMILVRVHAETPNVSRDRSPWWPVLPDADFTTFKVFVRVGEPCKITADDLTRGARFANLSESIRGNEQLSSEEDGQTLRILFATFPEQEGDLSLRVMMRFPDGDCESTTTIVFQITEPVQYREPHTLVSKPGDSVVFKLKEQGANTANCHLSSTQMGRFSLVLGYSERAAVVKDGLELNDESGELKVQLPLTIGDCDKSQTFRIQRKNKMRLMESFQLTFDFVTFSFTNCPLELIQGQAISTAISFVSTPDIGDLTELGVDLDIGVLTRCGFSFDKSKLQIVGTPDRALDKLEHPVTIACQSVRSRIKLKLPEVGIPKPPCLVPNAMPRIQFSLHKTATEINEAVVADHMFEASILKDYPTKLVKERSDSCDYELTFIMGIETEVQIAFDSDKLSSLERVHVQLQRHYHMRPENERWREWKPKENQLDFNITVVDGDLVIKGSPKAHWGDRDVRIDESGQRFRHYIAQITPQNKAGDGKPLNVLITCKPLKVFWGVAQTYTSDKMADNAEKLECCKADLETMVEDHRALGFDILLSCLDATGVSIDNTLKRIVVRIIQEVKATDIVYYMSGHGYEREETSKTMLLLRDEKHSADWDAHRNNLCIQNTVDTIAKVAHSSTFLLLIVDACRERLRAPELSKNPVSDTVLKLRISKMFKQIVIWFATSSGRLSIGGSGQAELSRFSGVLHQELVQIAQGTRRELSSPAPGEAFFPGMSALKARVHDRVRHLVLEKVSRRTQPSEAQVPDYREMYVCEAFTFNLPSFPSLPAALCAPPQQDSSANVVQVPSDADPRWRTLLMKRKVKPGDEISYIHHDLEVLGEVQSDGHIKYSAKTYYIDPVAFRTRKNDWASTGSQSERDACRALFAECLLNVGETKIQSLEELLSSCDSNGAPGAASGEGRGGGRSRERGGGGSRGGGAGGSVDEGGGGVGATGVRVKEGKGRLVGSSSCGGGEGAGGKIQSNAVSCSEKGKEIHPYHKKRSEGSSELVGKKRARDDAPSKKRMVSGVSGLKCVPRD